LSVARSERSGNDIYIRSSRDKVHKSVCGRKRLHRTYAEP
jgi:hypothetical protein